MELKTFGNQPHHSATREDGSISDPDCLWQTDREAWKNDQPATAFLAEKLPIVSVPASAVVSATTDGRRIYVNPCWSRSLDGATRRFTQAHLIWHCVAGHFRPPIVRDSHRWHLACDHEVNVVLLMLGFVLPPQAVLFPACIGKSLHAVYAWLADYPLLEEETSLDTPPWQATGSGHDEDETTALAAASLSQHWQHQACEVVHRYLDTPYLRPLMASWMTNRWSE